MATPVTDLPAPGIGALPTTLEEEFPTSVGETYPTYGMESQTLPEEYNIQTQYGTSALPAFEWARRIQTGEMTVQDSFDQSAAERIASATPQELEEEGISSETQAMIAYAVESGLQSLTSKAMASAGGDFLQTPMEFGGAMVDAGASYLPSWTGATPDIASELVHTPGTTMVEQSLATQMHGAGVAAGSGNFQTVAGNTYVPMDAAGVNNFRLANPAGPPVSGMPTPAMGTVTGADPYAGVYGAQAPTTWGGGIKNWWNTNTTGGIPTAAGMGFNFGIGFGMNLLMGQKPKDALKSAAIGTVGYGVGFLVAGPIGGAVGSAVASIAEKGSVICSELHRQGAISDSIYRITNYYCATKLTLTHIKGYHFWAVPVVKRLERGKGVKTWTFVYNHWANHIAYKAGARKKFDVCGWAISNTLETLSLGIGKIYEATSEKRRLGYANT